MELDFDKEMDAILRQAARSGDFLSAKTENHLDADEISAFAENALPEKTRSVYLKHFADCDRCRTILSNTILLNTEAETEPASFAAAPSAPEIVETKIPWYRKLFLMPNLAYTMGALVLIFGGMFGFLILQSINQTGSSDVSQIQTQETRSGGPSASDDGISYNSNSASAISNSAMASNTTTSNTTTTTGNSSADTTANMSNAATVNPPASAQNSPAEESLSELSTADAAVEQKRDQTLAKQSRENDFQTDGADDKKTVRKEETFAEKSNQDAEIARSDEAVKPTAAAPPPAPKPAQPSITQSQTENLSQRTVPAKKRADRSLSASAESTKRQIAGKTFNKVNGVWIDSAYNNYNSQMGNMILPQTKTIRRGSSEYQKLDRQVRVIAESLDAPVIILWKDGAYRIQ